MAWPRIEQPHRVVEQDARPGHRNGTAEQALQCRRACHDVAFDVGDRKVIGTALVGRADRALGSRLPYVLGHRRPVARLKKILAGVAVANVTGVCETVPPDAASHRGQQPNALGTERLQARQIEVVQRTEQRNQHARAAACARRVQLVVSIPAAGGRADPRLVLREVRVVQQAALTFQVVHDAVSQLPGIQISRVIGQPPQAAREVRLPQAIAVPGVHEHADRFRKGSRPPPLRQDRLTPGRRGLDALFGQMDGWREHLRPRQTAEPRVRRCEASHHRRHADGLHARHAAAAVCEHPLMRGPRGVRREIDQPRLTAGGLVVHEVTAVAANAGAANIGNG